MGTPGVPRRNNLEYSPHRLPDMYSGSLYQGAIESQATELYYHEGPYNFPEQNTGYETSSAYYGISPPNSKLSSNHLNSNIHSNHSSSAKSFAADKTNPLLGRDGVLTANK